MPTKRSSAIGADAVTVNPYLGRDALEPFLSRADKGVVDPVPHFEPRRARPAGSRCRRPQALSARRAQGRRRMERERQLPARRRRDLSRELAEVRAIVGDMPLLVPGVGAQGGDVEAVVRTAARRTARGSSSARRARSSMPTREPGSRTPQERRRKRSSQRSIGIADSVIAIYVMP